MNNMNILEIIISVFIGGIISFKIYIMYSVFNLKKYIKNEIINKFSSLIEYQISLREKKEIHNIDYVFIYNRIIGELVEKINDVGFIIYKLTGKYDKQIKTIKWGFELFLNDINCIDLFIDKYIFNNFGLWDCDDEIFKSIKNNISNTFKIENVNYCFKMKSIDYYIQNEYEMFLNRFKSNHSIFNLHKYMKFTFFNFKLKK